MVASKGANIEDLNRIRGRLSASKSGRLLSAALPAQVSTYILSDIIGDPAHLIGSGPTIPFNEEVDMEKILAKYDLRLDAKIEEILMTNIPPVIGEEAKFTVIGKNKIALEEVRRLAEAQGFNPVIIGMVKSYLILNKLLRGEAKKLRNAV